MQFPVRKQFHRLEKTFGKCIHPEWESAMVEFMASSKNAFVQSYSTLPKQAARMTNFSLSNLLIEIYPPRLEEWVTAEEMNLSGMHMINVFCSRAHYITGGINSSMKCYHQIPRV